MSTVEHELPHLLREHADAAPGAEGLLDAVHARSRRRARRRTTGGALVLAIVSAAGGLVAVTGAPGARGQVVLAWQSAPSSFLVPVDLRPVFPLTPVELPPGLSPEPRLMAERGTQTASWKRAADGQDGPLGGVSASVSATEPDQDSRTAATVVDVGGAPAALRRYEALTTVTWRRAPRQWVHVNGFAPVTEEQTLAFARALRDEPVRQPAAFAFEVAPVDHVLAEHHGTGLTLGPADGRPNPQDDPRAVAVSVRLDAENLEGAGLSVRIGGRSGWLDETDGRYQLVLLLDDELRLQVSTPTTGRWSREQLARFADGITYVGERPRPEG